MQCDFSGFRPPEIVKVRPVISVSRARNDAAPLCTVVPVSHTRPHEAGGTRDTGPAHVLGGLHAVVSTGESVSAVGGECL